jgi:hypothetical protein
MYRFNVSCQYADLMDKLSLCSMYRFNVSCQYEENLLCKLEIYILYGDLL